jgi:hypothetical protein
MAQVSEPYGQQALTENYTLFKDLGEGTFGKVKLG